MLNENSVNEMMRTIAQGYNDSYTQMFPMGAIYIYDIKGKVYKGDKVLIQGEKIIKATDSHSHEITALRGTLAGNKLEIEVRNLSNNEISIIQL